MKRELGVLLTMLDDKWAILSVDRSRLELFNRILIPGLTGTFLSSCEDLDNRKFEKYI